MLSIILKGTNGCNLACSYCSLGKKENCIIATKEQLYNIMKYSCEIAKNNFENKICFILHGGEPTLISVNTYEYVITKLKKEYTELKIELCMQTNGISISDEWIDFFIRNEVAVGISIDGSKIIHDKERRTVHGEPTFEVVQQNIIKLIMHGISVSCLMVLTSNALKEDYSYLEFFANNEIHLKINPLLDYGEVYENPELSLKRGQYAQYMIGLYEYILESDLDITISPIDKVLQGVLFNKNKIRECSFNKNCAKHFLCIDYKGDIYPCGKFSDMNKYCMGNITDKNYNIFDVDIIKLLENRRTEGLLKACKKCKYLELCNGGCNAEAYINGSLQERPAMCKDYVMLFEYFQGKGLKLLRKKLIERKKELGV